ncbi:MAG: glycerophosphodiester phosphodiesterase [Verrucomicrobiales bacterium]
MIRSQLRLVLRCTLALAIAAIFPTAQAQLIIAHRGASADAPENTLAAFKLAWERGADGIEGDFYLSKDGEIVCIHDGTTQRTSGKKANLVVAKTSFAELRKLDVGSWKNPKFASERIPTLREVIKTIPPEKQIFIEIKCGKEIVPVLKQQLAESPDLKPEQISIISFKEEVISACRKQLPHLTANWLVSYKEDKETAELKPAADSVFTSLLRTGASGLGTQAQTKVIDRAFVTRLRDAEWGFHCWTVNDPAVAKQFQALGVDSITTDRPAFIRQAIAATPDPQD